VPPARRRQVSGRTLCCWAVCRCARSPLSSMPPTPCPVRPSPVVER
jgi:hypothetical protein